LIYFSWGTVVIQSQQHQKAISKLVTPIWWWARFSGTDRPFNTSPNKNKYTEKYRKYFCK
jgi:hypothetical protein